MGYSLAVGGEASFEDVSKMYMWSFGDYRQTRKLYRIGIAPDEVRQIADLRAGL